MEGALKERSIRGAGLSKPIPLRPPEVLGLLKEPPLPEKDLKDLSPRLPGSTVPLPPPGDLPRLMLPRFPEERSGRLKDLAPISFRPVSKRRLSNPPSVPPWLNDPL
jgi:hypothetical protein